MPSVEPDFLRPRVGNGGDVPKHAVEANCATSTPNPLWPHVKVCLVDSVYEEVSYTVSPTKDVRGENIGQNQNHDQKVASVWST